jgi:hypothetical protein
LIKTLEQGIIEEEEQYYRNNRPSVGFLFKDSFDEIKRKAWEKIKFNYLLHHPEILMKIFPTLLPDNPPIAISITYSPYIIKSRTK